MKLVHYVVKTQVRTGTNSIVDEQNIKADKCEVGPIGNFGHYMLYRGDQCVAMFPIMSTLSVVRVEEEVAGVPG